MSGTTPKLEWRNIRKAFEGKAVLAGLDLSVAPGRSLVIIGGSGQGKSVTIKIAAGLMPADAGRMLVDGQDISAQPPKVRREALARAADDHEGTAGGDGQVEVAEHDLAPEGLADVPPLQFRRLQCFLGGAHRWVKAAVSR